MWIFLSKLASIVAYPLGLTIFLFLLGMLCRLAELRKFGTGLIIISVAVLITTSSPWFAVWALRSLENQYPPVSIDQTSEARLIVMLGGALALPLSPRLSAELTDSSDRILHTARLYRAGKASKIFLSGGNVFPEFHEKGESYYVAKLLVEWGVDESAIEMEIESRSTRQNALKTREYLERRGLINKSIILVTSSTHMPRAVATFRAVGINVIPSTTDISVTSQSKPSVFNWLPSLGALAGSTRAWHEYLGMWIYRMRDWA